MVVDRHTHLYPRSYLELLKGRTAILRAAGRELSPVAGHPGAVPAPDRSREHPLTK
jgi:hypothetical protein